MVINNSHSVDSVSLIVEIVNSDDSFFLIVIDFIPKRYVFSIVGLAATTLSVALQTNLSIAIVYMVKNTQDDSPTETFSECGVQHEVIFNKTEISQVATGEFEWTPDMQGIALGAQYLGLAVGYVPGGRLSEVYGGKITMISTLLMSSVLTALLPFMAHLSIYAFIACRFLIGMGTSPVFPALVYMISLWIPEPERMFVSSFILAGYGTGAFVSYVTAGALCASDFMGGWPSVFYLGDHFCTMESDSNLNSFLGTSRRLPWAVLDFILLCDISGTLHGDHSQSRQCSSGYTIVKHCKI
ncbi:unnamed protein product [Larinioides sclopetarius]|uniref:Major facilitator superfamily (MFS) profile domain-containing protein n=1 Tax=Larinioides sclopetarius TaxID=280406 RepID=A0AAV1ZGG2_9ARAC